MASPLDGLVRREIARGLRGQLKKGTLRRDNTGTSVDNYGDPVAGTPKLYAFEGIREFFSVFSKAQAGIPDTDVKILFILGLISPHTRPIKDDKVYIEHGWYQIRSILEIDPAGASMTVQAFQIPVPT